LAARDILKNAANIIVADTCGYDADFIGSANEPDAGEDSKRQTHQVVHALMDLSACLSPPFTVRDFSRFELQKRPGAIQAFFCVQRDETSASRTQTRTRCKL
jgi:hypothetical protein